MKKIIKGILKIVALVTLGLAEIAVMLSAVVYLFEK